MKKHSHRFMWLGYLRNNAIPEKETWDAAWCKCGMVKMKGWKPGPEKQVELPNFGGSATISTTIQLKTKYRIPA